MFESFQNGLREAMRVIIPTWNTMTKASDSANVGGNVSELPSQNELFVACNDEFFVQPENTTVNLFTVKDVYNQMQSQIVYPTEILQFKNSITASSYGSVTATKVKEIIFYKDTSITETEPYGDFFESPVSWFDYRCIDDIHEDIIITGLKASNVPSGDLDIVIPETIGGKPVVGVDSKFNSVLNGMVYEQVFPIVTFKSKSLAGLPNECFLNCTSLKEIWLPNCISLGESFVSGCSSLESVYVGSSTISIVKDAFQDSSSFHFFFPAGDNHTLTLSDETLSRNCFPYASEQDASRWSVEEKKSVTVSSIASIVSAFKADVDSKMNNTALYGSIATSSKDFGYTVDNDVSTLRIDSRYDSASSTTLAYTLISSGFVDGSEDTVIWNKYTETKTEVLPVINDTNRASSCTVRVVNFSMSHIQRLFISLNDNPENITSFNLYVSDTEPTSITDGTDLGVFEKNDTNKLLLEVDYTSTTSNIYFWALPTVSLTEANIQGYSLNMDGYPATVIDPVTGETSVPILLPPYGYAYTSSVNLISAEEDYAIYSPWSTFPSEWLEYEFYTVGLDQFVSITGLKTASLPAGLTMLDINFPSTIEGKTVKKIADSFNYDSGTDLEIWPIRSISSTTITLIGDSSFKNCVTLEEVSVSSLLEVGINCFLSCGCTFYNLPSLVTIDDGAFAFAGVNSLLYLGSTVPSIGVGAFENSPSMTALYPYGADVASSMYNLGILYDASPSGSDFVYCVPYTTAVKGATFDLVSVTFDSGGNGAFMNGEETCIRKYKSGEAYNSFPTFTPNISGFQWWVNYPSIKMNTTDLTNQFVNYLTAYFI